MVPTKKSMMKRLLFVIVYTVFNIGYSQSLDDSIIAANLPEFVRMDTSLKSTYPFINFQKNYFSFYSSTSKNWVNFVASFSKMTAEKKGKLNFYHIGGSHLQADIYTNDFRTFLQTNWPEIPGERGIVFPFDLAHTNNPSNYEFNSPNQWKGYRSVNHRPEGLDYGLMGAALVCSDSIITLSFRHDKTIVKPPYTQLRIYHNKGKIPFDLNFGEDELLVEHVEQDTLHGFTTIFFVDNVQELDLQFMRNQQESFALQLDGFQFMNNDPGISYTSIGVNGAGLYTYLENKNFEEQLSLYPPDFFAFSVGTNDANVPASQFDPLKYKSNLEKMIQKVLRTNPKCAILLTVPNDSYFHKTQLNYNISKQRTVIQELAAQYELAVWDLYGIMGELGASKIWQRNGLMQNDLVHFTPVGYHLKGALLIDAFLKLSLQLHSN
jgi:lysophospholipase L1-like esterase